MAVDAFEPILFNCFCKNHTGQASARILSRRQACSPGAEPSTGQARARFQHCFNNGRALLSGFSRPLFGTITLSALVPFLNAGRKRMRTAWDHPLDIFR